MLDLEPDGAVEKGSVLYEAVRTGKEGYGRGTGGPVLATGVRAARHVGEHRSHVGVGPEGPAQGHNRAGGGSGMEWGRLGAGVALQVADRDALDGAVAGNGAGDSGGLMPSVSKHRAHAAKTGKNHLVGTHVRVHVGLQQMGVSDSVGMGADSW